MEVVSAHGRARDRREAEAAQVVERARNTRAAGEQRKTRDRQHKGREKNGGRDREPKREIKESQQRALLGVGLNPIWSSDNIVGRVGRVYLLQGGKKQLK
jgi:hypothetical protein